MLPFSRFHLGLAAGLALIFLAPLDCQAQAKSKEVSFETIDKVDLKGTFYPSAGGNKPPCILFLHEIGGNRQKGGWDDLAKKLQNKGFAVLSFDFRGHNDSTTVDANVFWNTASNGKVFRPGTGKDKISYADVLKSRASSYHLMLVNDIAAAKRYLDKLNDAGDCNTSNLILIGAKEGAALGSFWMSKEFIRPHMIPNPLNPYFSIQDPKQPFEGDDLAGAVWLSMPERLNGQPVGGWLRGGPSGLQTALRDKVPMAFFYGEKDAASAKAAESIVNAMKVGSKSFDLTRTRGKKDATSSGAELLGKQEVDEEIGNYLEKVMEKRAERAWSNRDTAKAPPLTWVDVRPFQLP